MSKRVLITGASGYIGSVLQPYLVRHGYDCEGMDIGFFRDCLIRPMEPVCVRRVDMRDLTAAELRGFDAVVHLAGISNDPLKSMSAERVYDPTRAYSRQIAAWCRDAGIRFIFASSCSIYGQQGDGMVDEDSPTNPITPYSLNKLQIEQDVGAMASDSFKPVFLRFATVFGMSPRLRFDLVVNMFVGMAMTTGRIALNSDGMAWRPIVHIRDVCNAIHAALETPLAGRGPLVLNVGHESNNCRVIDLAHLVQSEFPGTEVTRLSAADELLADRKVQGTDARTYRVSFNRVREQFPALKAWDSVATGIHELAEALKAVGLTEAQFRNMNYYRLQKMENLKVSGVLDNDLRLCAKAT